MSHLPTVCVGDVMEHVRESERRVCPTGTVINVGSGLVTVQPADGTPKWTVDRYEVRHTPDSPPWVPERIE
ncbi:hypothetical protein B4N89_11805 [Embleya scabrispora]|uniref:DUF1918 domain-containing protein n=1 Tax=Embleya scabrispora TaxID=159449 RepID=A0A1T3NXG2_9ACTN|nr:hypothetical protein [Embleya scabrispora]OPC81537.1 hypothetical protein B4N89_11805 [Embleya scabrispora]